MSTVLTTVLISAASAVMDTILQHVTVLVARNEVVVSVVAIAFAAHCTFDGGPGPVWRFKGLESFYTSGVRGPGGIPTKRKRKKQKGRLCVRSLGIGAQDRGA